jgi:PAS domain S-box-containing protein
VGLWLAALVNSSDDAIFSKMLDGVITSWNTAAQQIYGYSAEQIIGKPVSVLSHRNSSINSTR